MKGSGDGAPGDADIQRMWGEGQPLRLTFKGGAT